MPSCCAVGAARYAAADLRGLGEGGLVEAGEEEGLVDATLEDRDPSSMHLTITSRRSRPDSRASSVGVR